MKIIIDVLFDFIEKLPKLSGAPKPYGFEYDEEIYVPQVNRTIVFRHGSHMERPVGPKEEDMNGPYLKE